MAARGKILAQVVWLPKMLTAEIQIALGVHVHPALLTESFVDKDGHGVRNYMMPLGEFFRAART